MKCTKKNETFARRIVWCIIVAIIAVIMAMNITIIGQIFLASLGIVLCFVIILLVLELFSWLFGETNFCKE